MSPFAVIQLVLVLFLVIIIANISLKFANKHMTKNIKIIKVIERVMVDNNSSLGVVKVCGAYYLMSFSSKDNKILKELDGEEIEDILEKVEKSNNLFEMRKKF